MNALVAAPWIHLFGNPSLIKGDHQMVGLDFDPEILFGGQSTTPAPMSRHSVHSCHEQKVTKFCTSMVLQCNQAHIVKFLQQLFQMPNLDDQHLDELEMIDQKLTKILLRADQAYTPPNPAPWSPALNQAYIHHCLWSVAFSACRNQCNMNDIITTLCACLCPTPEDDLEHMHLLSANLQHTQKALFKAKQEAEELCQKHLEELLNKAHATNKCKKTKAIMCLIHAKQNC